MALMVENINNDISSYASEKSKAAPGESYYRFYQVKLRQLVTQTRYRKEQEARVARQKSQSIDNRIAEQRLHKEYMNHVRERSKIQVQEILNNKTDDYRKRSDSVLSNSNRAVTINITLPNIPTPIIKTRPKPTPVKQERVISAPLSCQKNINKPKTIPKIKINHVDENLSKVNIHSFTQVTSSSSQNHYNKNYLRARQSTMDTIMLHLNSYKSSDISKWQTYRDINNKFASSISPSVYRNFERCVV